MPKMKLGTPMSAWLMADRGFAPGYFACDFPKSLRSLMLPIPPEENFDPDEEKQHIGVSRGYSG
jgi:hypothetical protein